MIPLVRPPWSEIWAEMAKQVARRSRCVREQIGCVIVDDQQRVLATSYTGPPPDFPCAPDARCDSFCLRAREGPTEQTARSYTDCFSNHSEINGLLMTDRSDREGGAIYVTSYPCFSCAKAIASSGLAEVYLVSPPEAEHRVPVDSLQLLMNCGLTVHVL